MTARLAGMSGEKTSIADDVWAWTLRVYAEEGVAAACIGLQDRHGVGVSVLLALMGLAARGHGVPEPGSMSVVLQRAERWQRSVIEPLRRARRGLSSAPPAAIAGPAESVRQVLLAQEMETERLQQQLLVSDVLDTLTPGGRQQPADSPAIAAESIARRYMARFFEPMTDDGEAALRILLAAITRVAMQPCRD